MSLYQLKSQFQDQLRPVSDMLVKHHCTANQVTISAVVLSMGTAYVIATRAGESPRLWLSLPLSLFMRMALNAIDGMMAREHGQASTMGAVLNEAGDLVADTVFFISILPHLNQTTISGAHNHGSYQQHIASLSLLSIGTELLAIGSSIGFQERANQGPLGKSDRALLLGVLGTVMGMKLPLTSLSVCLSPLFIISEALLIKTCLNRLRFIAELYLRSNPPQLRSNRAVFLSHADDNTFEQLLTKKIQLPLKHTSSKLDNLSEITHVSTPHHLDIQTMAKPSSPHYFHQSACDQTLPISGESCFNAYDGTAIYYRYWLTMPIADIKSQAANQLLRQVILLHRGHEHSGRLAELGVQFAKAGYQVFAWDARGNGRSGGIKDHADSVTELERDLNGFVQLIRAQTGIAIEDTLIVASSIGAVLAAAWVHDYAPNIRGMILGTPALNIRLYMPFAIPTLKVARTLGMMSRVSSYVKAQVLTHDKAAQEAYNADPLISSSISTDLLIDTHATGQRLLDDAAAITAPVFVLCAGKDYVVDKQAERDFYEAINTPIKRWQLYPDSYHAIFHETNKADVFADCLDFAEQVFATSVQMPDLNNAHLASASKDKVDRLAIKPFNPSFAITRFAMQKFGHVSQAISAGLEHGFDSGSSLDKVYDNTPSGRGAVGRAIDKFYLNNIGWQGIRVRREHLLELAGEAITHIQMQKEAQDSQHASISEQPNHVPRSYTPKLLDIASGHGAYVFDLLEKFDNLHAELRDYETYNAQALQAKAEHLGMGNRVVTYQKDAFDSSSYHNNNAVTPAFDIAIASGVFELFSDNTLLATALAGMYASLQAGGYLIYTNQPWHPEQEFISKTLNNHRGSSWVMRCRSQAEMDQLVERAGFEKVSMRIDKFGIFTVSLAKKPLNADKDSEAPLKDSKTESTKHHESR